MSLQFPASTGNIFLKIIFVTCISKEGGENLEVSYIRYLFLLMLPHCAPLCASYCTSTKRRMKTEGKTKQSWKFGGNEFCHKGTAKISCLFHCGQGWNKTKTILLLISTTGISTSIFASLQNTKLFSLPDCPQPNGVTRELTPYSIWLVVAANKHPKSRICCAKQCANAEYKDGLCL